MKGSNKGFYEKFHRDIRLQKRAISDDNFTYKNIIEVLRKIIPMLKGKSVLDVGCGVGTIDFYLAKLNFEVFGIDISEKAIEMSILNAKHLGLRGKTKFKSGDFLKESFDKKFDLIICSEVIEHIRNDDDFISKAHNLLKKNGLIFVTTPSNNSWLFKMGFLGNADKKGGHLRRYSMDVLEDKFRKHDFKIIAKKKTDGLLRNLLFSFKAFDIVNKAANTVPVISKTFSFIDRSLIPLFGETDLILVAKINDK